MSLIGKNKQFLKRLYAVSVLIFSTLYSYAGFTDKVKNAVTREFASLQGVWIMLGLIGGGLTMYLIVNKVQKRAAEKEAAQEAAQGGAHHHTTHHHRHRRHRAVKKA